MTDALLSLADIRPGLRVIDCGCGSGEMALAVAEAVQPGGSVLGVDFSPGMIELARAAASGRTDVEFRVADLQELDESGFDAAVSRMVLMLVPDERAALARILRALKPGARFACSVWAESENPRLQLPAEIYRGLAGELPPQTSMAKVLRLGREELLRDRLEGAGFRDVVTMRVRADVRAENVDQLLAEMRRNPGTVELFEQLDPGQRELAWQRLEAGFRELATPAGILLRGEQVVAAGTA